ncbi:MAG: hypothetical protein LBP22_15015 [Deltaproteobacteria bacterium]|jgi:hypothetical protein|nr:hypothetical protein [Deltaproteobacteria bacterium]
MKRSKKINSQVQVQARTDSSGQKPVQPEPQAIILTENKQADVTDTALPSASSVIKDILPEAADSPALTLVQPPDKAAGLNLPELCHVELGPHPRSRTFRMRGTETMNGRSGHLCKRLEEFSLNNSKMTMTAARSESTAAVKSQPDLLLPANPEPISRPLPLRQVPVNL